MNKKFQDFIKYSDSQKEVGLVVAGDIRALDSLKTSLLTSGYKEAKRVDEILKSIKNNSKILYVIEDSLPKSLYDLIAQYPTGQVEVFDYEKMKSTIAVPEYQGSSIVVLITKENLIHFQKKGYRVLEHTGLTYQS